MLFLICCDGALISAFELVLSCAIMSLFVVPRHDLVPEFLIHDLPLGANYSRALP